MKLNWESALLVLLVLEILLFGAINPRMLDINMLLFSTSDFICIGIVALPLTLVIISGGIDISLGSTIGLCAIALGVMMQAGWPMAVAIPLTLLLGLLCGLVNAALIHYTGISPLVITLGTLYLYGGGALLLSGMAGATGYEGIGGFPDSFTAFANLTVLGLPIPLVLFEAPCLIRQQVLNLLDEARIPWRIVLTSQSLAGIWSAVNAGLGFTVRSRAGLPQTLQCMSASELDLPQLPPLGIRLHRARAKEDRILDTLQKNIMLELDRLIKR